VWGVFAGGRAHRAAVGLEAKERSGRQDSAGGSWGSVNLANLPHPGDQDRERACVVLDDVDSGLGRSPGRWPMPVGRADLMRRVCPSRRHARLNHGSAPGLDEVLTPYNLGRAFQSGT
jgi:hypothetical protein